MNIDLTPQDADRLARVLERLNTDNPNLVSTLGPMTLDQCARLVLSIALQDRCAQLDRNPRREEQMG